jgi:hypothetical protein
MARIKSSDKTNRKLSTAPLSGVVDVMNTNAAIKLSVSSFLNKDKQAFPTGLQPFPYIPTVATLLGESKLSLFSDWARERANPSPTRTI